MSRFLQALHSGRLLLMDGAMGTELRRAGLPDNGCGERWNLTHPERIRAVHEAYVAAGADVLLTNTFQGNPRRSEHWQAYNRAGVELARSVAGPDRFVLGDIGPVGAAPGEDLSPALYQEIARSLTGVDALLLETFASLEILSALPAIHEALKGEVPILLSLTYRHDNSGDFHSTGEEAPLWSAGRIHAVSGETPDELARQLGPSPIAALGVNCGRDVGMAEVIEIVRRYRLVSDLPLFARPNAGTPSRLGERWVYPQTPLGMAARVPALLAAGACMIGGCCGTTPDHIAAFRAALDV